MTPGERFVRSMPLKTSFYDAHERRAYLRTAEVAARLIDDPSLIHKGRVFLDRFVRDDDRQRGAYETWVGLLERSPEDIARALLSDSESGAGLRESAPVFVVIPEPEVREIWQRRA